MTICSYTLNNFWRRRSVFSTMWLWILVEEYKHLRLRMTPFFSFENNLFLEEYFGRDKDGYKRYYFDFVGNKVKGQISKWVFQENKACQIFRKTNISYFLIRSKKCPFFGKFDVLCFLETPFWDSPFCRITDDFWIMEKFSCD